MLRGVNVGGHNSIKMESLRTMCESLGLRGAQTYVQSGNVVFKTGPEISLSWPSGSKRKSSRHTAFALLLLFVALPS
jgi:hypothetical protein